MLGNEILHSSVGGTISTVKKPISTDEEASAHSPRNVCQGPQQRGSLCKTKTEMDETSNIRGQQL